MLCFTIIFKDNIKDLVFETFIYFVQQPNEDIQTYTLKAIGSLCIRYYDFMLGVELKALYHKFLTSDDAPLQMRTQVILLKSLKKKYSCYLFFTNTIIKNLGP